MQTPHHFRLRLNFGMSHKIFCFVAYLWQPIKVSLQLFSYEHEDRTVLRFIVETHQHQLITTNPNAWTLIIIIVNSKFLMRPQRRIRGNQLIHRCLSKTESIGSGLDPESPADRQTAMVDGVWSWDGREVRRRGWIRIGSVEEQCFKFGVNELWKDSKGWGSGENIHRQLRPFYR